MECSFECVVSETTPQQVNLISELRKTSRYARSYTLNQIVFTKSNADQRSFRMKWWRRGPSERGEEYAVSDDLTTASPRSIYAFDGQLLRFVNFPKRPGQVSAAINTAASWQADRTSPFTWLYLFSETPYADIVTKATRFEAEEVQASGKTFARYTIESPKLDKRTLVLLFDESGRLAERQWISSPMPGEEPDLGWRVTFSDYRAYADPSGETIWFPRQVVYDTYLGRLPDRRLVQNTGERYRVLDVKFNVDIPDSIFDLEIPSNATVWDGVNTMSYLEPGNPLPVYVLPPEAGRWRLAIVAGAVFLTVAAVAWVTWRRRKAASAP